MSEKKTIQFNPDLFNFSTNKTRKKKESTKKSDGIKVKSESSGKKMDTLKKRSILRMIRQHQEESYKNLLGINNGKKEEKKNNYIDESNIHSDFENSKIFLNKMVEENEQKEKNGIINRTIKRYPTQTQSLLYDNIVNPIEVTNITQPTVQSSHIQLRQQPTSTLNPKYGCLKGGNLPTYRNWVNRTQKVLPNQNFTTNIMNNNGINPNLSNIINNQNSNNTNQNIGAVVATPSKNEIVEQKIDDSLKRMSEIKQTMSKLQMMKNSNIKKKMKQKKTIRRTYKIGKSKVFPRISVLVSNKTIRNNISTKTQLLKQVPIQYVKKFLIKRGFIKVGSTAPNDILRKMYESAILICGEVQNHNPENLLYNFMNDDK